MYQYNFELEKIKTTTSYLIFFYENGEDCNVIEGKAPYRASTLDEVYVYLKVRESEKAFKDYQFVIRKMEYVQP